MNINHPLVIVIFASIAAMPFATELRSDEVAETLQLTGAELEALVVARDALGRQRDEGAAAQREFLKRAKELGIPFEEDDGYLNDIRNYRVELLREPTGTVISFRPIDRPDYHLRGGDISFRVSEDGAVRLKPGTLEEFDSNPSTSDRSSDLGE